MDSVGKTRLVGSFQTGLGGGGDRGACQWSVTARLRGFRQFQHANFFFHLLTRLERDDILLRHIHPFSSAWIASFSGRSLFDFKDSKVAKFDPAFLNQCVHDRVESLLDDFLRLQLRQANFVRDGFDDLFLGHDGSLLPKITDPLRVLQPTHGSQRYSQIQVSVKSRIGTLSRRHLSRRSKQIDGKLPHPFRIDTARNFSPILKIGKFELACEGKCRGPKAPIGWPEPR